ncbi:MAG: T9SS type A sorting domain-containing protein [Bacteroidales bacterium]|nr:T9SS type A sorting domain-containing protein [Bacteroidales bacterium]
MKQLSLLFMAMVASFTLQAQWTDNPANNNLIGDHVSSSTISGEILTVTDVETNDTYFHWGSLQRGNGYAPTFQRLTADGTPKWGPNGIRMTQLAFLDHSDGRAIDITPDHDLIACFSTADTVTVAVKINTDGNYAWGEQGVLLFGGKGGSRAEIIAGKDNGAWALGSDSLNLYLQYINADGSLNPLITIEPATDTTKSTFGKLVLRDDNSVFLTYENVWIDPNGYSNWGSKELYLTGYTKDGTQNTPTIMLMPRVDCVTPYCHYVEPDGLGGAYTYSWFSNDTITSVMSIHVFHYDANGNSTISDPYGATVHSTDHHHNYTSPYVSVDPISHDLLLTYIKNNQAQHEEQMYMNRLTSTGERVWDDGVLVFDNPEDKEIYRPTIAAFEDGSGFAVTYGLGVSWTQGDPRCHIEAKGYDMNCNELWETELSSSFIMREFAETISGFHHGQNIIAWANDDNGDIYAQNFGVDGSMGQGLDVEEIFEDEEIVTIVKVFNVNGQVMQCRNLNELNIGVYIIQGTTESGKTINKKIVVTKE